MKRSEVKTPIVDLRQTDGEKPAGFLVILFLYVKDSEISLPQIHRRQRGKRYASTSEIAPVQHGIVRKAPRFLVGEGLRVTEIILSIALCYGHE